MEGIKEQLAAAVKAAKEERVSPYRICRRAGIQRGQLIKIEQLGNYTIDTYIRLYKAMKDWGYIK